MEDVIRLQIVGNDAKHRRALAASFGRDNRFDVLGHVGRLEVVHQELESLSPDVLVIDMAGYEGLNEVIRDAARVGVGVLLLGARRVPGVAFECLEAGARGYLRGDASIQDLSGAVETIAAGGAVTSPDINHWMYVRLAELSQEQRRSRNLVAQRLTGREQEILTLVSEGRTNKEIAKQLHRSTHTVKNHLHQIFKTLQVRNRSQAVEVARRRGWLKKPAVVDG